MRAGATTGPTKTINKEGEYVDENKRF